MDLYQQTIHKSRYARYLPEIKRREHYNETIKRYVDFVTEYVNKNHNGKLKQTEIKQIEQAIANQEVMPSMRQMMVAGPALVRDNTAGYNCSFLQIDDIKAFDECMHILMCGTGVGFSVERQYIQKLPEIPDQLFDSDTVIIVKDSREGWAKSLRMLISMLYAGEIPQWDVSKLRLAGAILKTFGGRSSGPDPLVDLFNFVVNMFKNAVGRKLTSIECHDIMCKIGDVVVVGGVRRSAMISLSNLSDDRMRNAKSGAWWDQHVHRALSNNSAVYEDKPDMSVFMQEWQALYESKSGERGIFSRAAAENIVSKNDRRESGYSWGTNPCCFTGDMKLLTSRGYQRFDHLAKNESTEIVNSDGKITKGKVWYTADKETIFVNFEQGLGRNPLQVTPDHVFKLTDNTDCHAKDLKGKRIMPFIKERTFVANDAFRAGFILGDGLLTRLDSETHKGLEIYFSGKDTDIAFAFGVPTGPWYSRENYKIAEQYKLPPVKIGDRGFPNTLKNVASLQGLFSANGYVVKNTRVALRSIDKEQILGVQEFLAAIQIDSYITTNKEKLHTFRNGEFVMKENYDLNISRYDSILRFAAEINFGQTYKRVALKNLLLNRSPKVKSIKSGPVVPVYDFTEPETHWGVVEKCVVHNSEIILRPNQFCNLSEVIARTGDTVETLKEKVRIATIIGTIQSTLTHFPYLRKIWKKNTEEERLLGVSLTGIYDCPLLNTVSDSTANLLNELRKIAIETNKEYAKRFGIPQSAAITCIKPSGTVSQLTDSSSGIHTRHDKYYIRRIRQDNKDPLTKFLIEQGVPAEPDVTKPHATTVFSFYKKTPEGAVTRNEITALNHLNLWLQYQRHWCEHKPSVTISVKEEEWMEVGAWVYRYFDEVSGISFLPYDGGTYRQAPYETITEDEYNVLSKNQLTILDWDKFAETEDNVEGTQTLACSSVLGCEI